MTAERDERVLTARSARVRDARQLTVGKHRRTRRELLADGPQAVREALAAGVCRELFVEAGTGERHAGLVGAAVAAGLAVHRVDSAGLAGLSGSQTPQGVVALCGWAPGSLGDLAGIAAVRGDGQVVLTHEMADPGNAGALIRVADAAGADAVALSARSVDPTNPKCVRATAGSLFHLLVVAAGDTLAAIGALRSAGHRILAADATPESVDLFSAERAGLLDGRICWVFGNEAHGLPDEVRAVADEVVSIPIHGRAESLNLATAAAVCLYAKARLAQSA